MKKILQSLLTVSMLFQIAEAPIIAKEETNDDVIVEESKDEVITEEAVENIEVEDNQVPEEVTVDEQIKKGESGEEISIADDVIDIEDDKSQTTTESKPYWKQESNGKWRYYINAQDCVKNSMYKCYDGYFYCFDSNGYMVTNQFYSFDHNTYYFGSDGKEVSGWLQIYNKWYYFHPSFYNAMVVSNDVYINGKYYAFDEKGVWIEEGIYKPGWALVNGYWYYYDSSTERHNGWLKDGNYWYYFENGYMQFNMTQSINGNFYCFDNNGHMLTNVWKQDGVKWRYYGTDGKAATGWNDIGGKWYYFLPQEENVMAVSRNLVIEGKNYTFDKNGAWKQKSVLKKGWNKVDGNWYYYDTPTKSHNGWLKDGSYWYYIDDGKMKVDYNLYYNTNDDGSIYSYYFDQNGHMVTNKWIYSYANYWRYYGNDGKTVKGWNKINNTWYYFRPMFFNMMAESTEIKINGKYYAFDYSGAWIEQGTHKKGWIQKSTGWFYYDTSVIPHNGWLKDGDYWYYCEEGKMMWGCAHEIEGIRYRFDYDGHLITNKWLQDGTDQRRYYNSDGEEASGWKMINNRWYYFNPKEINAMAVNCTLTLSDGTYTFDSNGYYTKK